MIHTAIAAKRMWRLPSRLAVRRQRKKSRISRNGEITRKMSTRRAARGSAASEKPALKRPAVASAKADRHTSAIVRESGLTFSASGARPATSSKNFGKSMRSRNAVG